MQRSNGFRQRWIQLGRSQADARHAIWDLTSPERGQPLNEALEIGARRLCGEAQHLTYNFSGSLQRYGPMVEEQFYRIGIEAVATQSGTLEQRTSG
jgi:hypothetical protein